MAGRVTAAGPAPPVDPARFRGLMARWATGVSVVTAHQGPGDAGLTVNALVSVSLTPPSLLVSVSRDADTLAAITASGRFGVSFLAADQRPLSERFAAPVSAEEKFRGVAIHRAPGGSPLLDGSIGAVECRLAQQIPAFDHVLLIGEVLHAELGGDRPPLVFFRSSYATAEGADRLGLPPSRA